MPHLSAKRLTVSFKLSAEVSRDPDTQSFMSYCPALDLYSAGRTDDHARSALVSGAEMYLRHCFQRGILDRMLTEGGFSAVSPTRPGDLEGAGQFMAVREKSLYEFNVSIPMEQEIAPCQA